MARNLDSPGRAGRPRYTVRNAIVPGEPTTAESMETAKTPASHRPRNGREEVAVPMGVTMRSPATVAAGDPAREGGRTDVSGMNAGSGWGPAVGVVSGPSMGPFQSRRLRPS